MILNPGAEFGRFVREYRQEQGLSQAWVAAQVGISESALCRIELGQQTPYFDVAAKILDVLGLSTEDRAFLLGQLMDIEAHASITGLPNLDHLLSFDVVEQLARKALERGDIRVARHYMNRLEELAVTPIQIARTRLALGASEKDFGRYFQARDFLLQALQSIRNVEDEELRNKIRVNLADVEICLMNDDLADALLDKALKGIPEGTRFYFWVLYLKGRIEVIRGNIPSAVCYFVESSQGLRSCEDVEPNMAEWVDMYRYEAEAMSADSRLSGVQGLRQLILMWGPDESHQMDPEIYAWASLKLGMIIDDPDMLAKAEAVASKENYGALLRIVRSLKVNNKTKSREVS